MSTVGRLAEEVERGLLEALPGLRKTVREKLALAVGAMLEGGTPNTAELASLLPLARARQDMREQWLRRLLKNPLLDRGQVMEPFARQVLAEAAACGRTILLLMDQTEIGERFAILMLSVRVGERALPLAWHVEPGAANIGFNRQRGLLEQVGQWLPAGAPVLLSADRFYPSAGLFEWLHARGWQYRLRLKGNLTVDVGHGHECTTGELAAGVRERYEPQAQLFAAAIPTAIGILHEPDHPAPWIIAMECPPNRAAVRDYGARWAIEPSFSDFKSRGFDLTATQLHHPERRARWLLIMALAMYGCVRTGDRLAREQPTALEKKPTPERTPRTGSGANCTAVPCPGSPAGGATSSAACRPNNPYRRSIARFVQHDRW